MISYIILSNLQNNFVPFSSPYIQVVRPLYDRLHTDLKKFEGGRDTEIVDTNDALANDLAKQLSQFISARKEMIDLYPFLWTKIRISLTV